MKIERTFKLLRFINLSKGDVFKYRSFYYMRVDAGEYNAVELTVGDMRAFGGSEDVVLVTNPTLLVDA